MAMNFACILTNENKMEEQKRSQILELEGLREFRGSGTSTKVGTFKNRLWARNSDEEMKKVK